MSSAYVGSFASAANTTKTFIAGTSLATAANYSPTGLPAITNDVLFAPGFPTATSTFSLTAASQTVGSINDTNLFAVTISNTTSGSTASTYTLGGTGNLGNGVSGTAGDLIYVGTGSTLNFTNGSTGNLNLALGQAGIFDINGTSSIGAAITGTFGVQKTGSGVLTLSGSNTFTGSVTLSSGTLNINSAAALGTTAGTFTIGAGTTLNNTSGASVTTAAKPVSIGSGFTFTGANNLTLGGAEALTGDTTIATTASTFGFGGVLSGTGAITKTGAGTLSLANANNTFTGNIALNGGTLALFGGASLGAGVNSTTLGANSTIQVLSNTGFSGTGGIHPFITNGFNLSLDSNGVTVTFGNTISGSGGVTKVGSGQVNLNTAETYTGTTAVNAGTLNLSVGGSLASTALALNGGTFSATTGRTSSINFATTAISTGTNAISIPAFSTAGLSLGLGTVSRTGTGTLDITLPTTGTITAATPVALPGGQASILGGYATIGGTTYAAVAPDGTVSGLTAYDTSFTTPGADVDVTASATQVGAVTAINSLRFNTASPTTLTLTPGTVGSGGGLAIATGGILNTANVGANASTITGGDLTSNNGVDLIVQQNNATAGGALTIASNITDSTAGAGSTIGLTKTGAGTLVLTGTNAYTGVTNIVAGTVQVGDSGTSGKLGTGAVVIGGSLAYNESGVIDPFATTGTVTGTGNLIMNGSGTLVLSKVTSYTGGTVFNAGTVEFATTNNAGTGGFTFNGGALRQTANLTSARSFLFNAGGATIDVSSGATFSLSGAITGTGPLMVNGPTVSTTGVADVGQLTLQSSTANTYSGGTIVNAGSLGAYFGTSLGTGTVSLTASRIVFNNAGSVANTASTFANALSLAGANTIQVGNQISTNSYPNSLTSSGSISGNGSLLKTGPGSITFTNATANTYTGGTTINQGVIVGVSGSFGTGDFTIAPAPFATSTVTTNNPVAVTSNGSIASTANVTVNNSATDATATGTLTFAGTANTIGSLAGNGRVVLGTTALTVGNTATTLYSGVLSGTGGTVTKVGTGTLSFTGVNTYTGATVVNGGSLSVKYTSAGASAATPLLSNAGGTDIQAGSVVFDYSGDTTPAATIRGLLQTSYAAGFASGQIKSTTATANKGLGYKDTGSSVIVKTALYGDADLDGGVTIADFNALALSFGTSTGKVWADGDFDYDGGVGISDFNALALNFGSSLPAGADHADAMAGLMAFAIAHDDLPEFYALTGVPEPTSLALIGVGAMVGLRRRRNAARTAC